MAECKYPDIIEDIIDGLKSLPGIGKRTAERLALAVLKWKPDKVRHFGEALQSLPEAVTYCPECGNLSQGGKSCDICISASRDRTVVCVVEDFTQIMTIENSACFKGVYHVLGGKLAPLEKKLADALSVELLLKRIQDNEVKEVILALSPDVEGQATAVYVGGLLKDRGVKITRLAQGLPAGSDISYADSATIGAALSGRTEF
ncbi:recombination mediator RecR [Lentisphaerota bacterium ZTH]|nr:recombination protein RecR [Lentisphaerota bacterium]WET07204.1 recombination mediator RecR [Lentisphaerota bacterium ZTH]